MPPKKRPGKDFLVECSPQTVGGQVLETTQTTTQPQTFAELCPATAEIRRPREPLEQPVSQAEAPPMKTSTPSIRPPLQHQETKTQEDT
jgi:hypothetical protein